MKFIILIVPGVVLLASLRNRWFGRARRIGKIAQPRKLKLQPLEQRTVPAGFIVDDPGDAGMGNGLTGDLRFCINQANDEGNFPSEDEITFAVAGPITLNSDLLIESEMKILGPGSGSLTIDGNGNSRIFTINPKDPISVTISGLTIMNGNGEGHDVNGQGGGIYSKNSNLILSDCKITENTADGIIGSGGGLMLQGGTATLANGYEISENKANGINFKGHGGGIYSNNVSQLTIADSTKITANTATGYGGGVYVLESSLTCDSVSISFNSADLHGGGIAAVSGSVKVNNNSKIFQNTAKVHGGGIYSGAPLTLDTGTTVSLNTAAGDGGGVWVNATTNILGRDTDATTIEENKALGNGGGIFAGPSQLTITSANIGSNTAGLNGGGIYSELGSPTINKAVGAMNERFVEENEAIKGGGIYVNNTKTSNYIQANVKNNKASVDGGGIYSVAGNDAITNSTILGNTATVNGGGIATFGSLTATTANINGNSALNDGGGLWSSAGSVTITITANSMVDQNKAGSDSVGSGGGIWMSGGKLVMQGMSEDVGNTAELHGGGMYLFNTDLEMDNCSFGNDKALAGDGGGAWLKGGIDNEYNVRNSDFSRSFFAGQSGGSIRLEGGALTLLNTRIGDGVGGPFQVLSLARVNGGGISAVGGTLEATSCVISGGVSSSETITLGGGLYSKVPTTLTSCYILGGTNLGGGAFFVGNAPILTFCTIEGVALADQSGTGNGGGLYVDSTANVTVETSVFAFGEAGQLGGGIFNLGQLSITSSTIRDSSAVKGGGGIYAAGGSLTLKSCTVHDNDAKDPNVVNPAQVNGGGIRMIGGSAVIINCTISGNQATHGGGIAFEGVFTTLKNCTVTGNNAMGIEDPQGPDVAGKGGGVLLQNMNNEVNLSESTIIAGNTRIVGDSTNLKTGADIHNDSPTGTIDAQFSLIGVADMGFSKSLSWINDPANQHNREGPNAMPLSLAPLDFNGGPNIGHLPNVDRLMTHRLLADSKAIDGGINSSKSSYDQRGASLVRTYDIPSVANEPTGDKTDIGAYELQPPKVLSVTTYAESTTTLGPTFSRPSKSRVTFMNINFDQPIEFSGIQSDAFSFERLFTMNLGQTQDTGPVPFNLFQVGSNGAGNSDMFKMTFPSSNFTETLDPYNSLIDGRYELKISANEVSVSGVNLAGNMNGDLGTDYESEQDPSRRIWRLFGDLTGLNLNYIPDAKVLSEDFNAFQTAFGVNSSSSTFQSGLDFLGDGLIDSGDFQEFRRRFGLVI